MAFAILTSSSTERPLLRLEKTLRRWSLSLWPKSCRPSSYGRDFVDKLTDYRGIDSLNYYLILSHQEPRVWLSSRDPDGWNKPQEIAGTDRSVDLGLLGLELPLADLYDGVAVRSLS